ncbi:MAG: GGDEF domain-containing protein [Coriobacteriales bacterium]|nr:GGDEF domain-containing protein [Coriobacteriales bacterium]
MRQYRIGLMGVHSEFDYPKAMRMGVQNTIEEAGHTLVAIAELIPYHTLDNAEAYFRVATEISARLDLDVIVFPAGCVAAYLKGDTARSIELAQILDPAKTLILERSIPGYRCITKSNDPGMHECMRHLIETCGFTKIAFISGPEHSQGARDREAVYFEEMAAHGLQTPPSLFGRGFFSGDCEEAAERILEQNPDVEAIACACDVMAYRVYDVLKKHKIDVGTQVAVTGFDDHPRSAHMDPPLSTVRMTSYDYGCMAAREALRMCEGLPQREDVLTSTFVPRCSCGEDVRGDLEYFRELLRQKPFPVDEFVSIIMDYTLSLAGQRITTDFRAHVKTFFAKVRTSYLAHCKNPQPDDLLFSGQDLSVLFEQDYSECLSLEGFHTAAITLLEALVEESPKEDANWVIEQISHLHLRIARLMSSTVQKNTLSMNEREWITFHMVDDALRKSGDIREAYRLIFGELARLGIREADLFLLPEPLDFVGSKSFALSDTVHPLGGVHNGEVYLAAGENPVVLQELMQRTLGRRDHTDTYTVGGVMAGTELMGVAALNTDTLDLNAQLMAFLNLGFALKHLQMIANEREMNRLLNKNNLRLEEQSQHDEMTGLLNRRGFMNQIEHLVHTNQGKRAAVMYLDLDGLKTINDTMGHDMGDEAIKNTAATLRAILPKQAILSRMGGDEYAAFVILGDDKDALGIVEASQEGMRIFNATHDVPYELSISAGVCSFEIDKDTALQISDYMVQADTSLYEMKRKRKASRSYQGTSTLTR